MSKLVRDLIPSIVKNSGGHAYFRKLSQTEYIHYLYQKLDEELTEFKECSRSNPQSSIKELVNIQQVIFAIANSFGLSDKEFLKATNKKKLLKGGFDNRILLIKE